MKKAYAKLRRRPLLTPVWLSALAVAGALVIIGAAAWAVMTAESTLVVVIRHAETGGGDDPPLSVDGQARAERLAALFGVGGSIGPIDAIYSSATHRSQMTAAPLAARLKMTVITVPADDAEALARRVLHANRGGRALIVCHGDTVGPVVTALSGENDVPALSENEYGTLYMVSVPRLGRANVLTLHY